MLEPNEAPHLSDLEHGLNQLWDVVRFIDELPGSDHSRSMLAVLALVQKAGISLERGARGAGLDCPVVGDATKWMESGTRGSC